MGLLLKGGWGRGGVEERRGGREGREGREGKGNGQGRTPWDLLTPL